MKCDRCGKAIIGGTGRVIDKRHLHSWCTEARPRAEGITRGAFVLSLGALLVGGAVIGVRGRGAQAVKNPTPVVPLARDVRHDFQSGLDQRLLSPTNAPSGWRLNGLGVIPRELRLFEKASLPSDYTVRFRCSVEEGAMGWVCRAKDWQNHEGFVLGKSQGKAEIVRFRTVDGIRTDLARIPLDRYSGLSTLTISTKMDRDLFSLQVGGLESDPTTALAVVDAWRDPTFSRGTFGFFAEGTGAPVLYDYQILDKARTS